MAVTSEPYAQPVEGVQWWVLQMRFVLKLRRRFGTFGSKKVRRVVVFVVGMTVLLIGIALLVLPGPAILVIPAGLAILGLEFRWARNWMRKAKGLIKSSETRFLRKDANRTGRKEATTESQPTDNQLGQRSMHSSPRQGGGKVESVVN